MHVIVIGPIVLQVSAPFGHLKVSFIKEVFSFQRYNVVLLSLGVQKVSFSEKVPHFRGVPLYMCMHYSVMNIILSQKVNYM